MSCVVDWCYFCPSQNYGIRCSPLHTTDLLFKVFGPIQSSCLCVHACPPNLLCVMLHQPRMPSQCLPSTSTTCTQTPKTKKMTSHDLPPKKIPHPDSCYQHADTKAQFRSVTPAAIKLESLDCCCYSRDCCFVATDGNQEYDGSLSASCCWGSGVEYVFFETSQSLLL
jgi:hypothetical protein